MFRQHVDVLSFGEIGGVGEMTYHTVRFPRYELRYEGNIALLCPRYEKDDVLIDHQAGHAADRAGAAGQPVQPVSCDQRSQLQRELY